MSTKTGRKACSHWNACRRSFLRFSFRASCPNRKRAKASHCNKASLPTIAQRRQPMTNAWHTNLRPHKPHTAKRLMRRARPRWRPTTSRWCCLRMRAIHTIPPPRNIGLHSCHRHGTSTERDVWARPLCPKSHFRQGFQALRVPNPTHHVTTRATTSQRPGGTHCTTRFPEPNSGSHIVAHRQGNPCITMHAHAIPLGNRF